MEMSVCQKCLFKGDINSIFLKCRLENRQWVAGMLYARLIRADLLRAGRPMAFDELPESVKARLLTLADWYIDQMNYWFAEGFLKGVQHNLEARKEVIDVAKKMKPSKQKKMPKKCV